MQIVRAAMHYSDKDYNSTLAALDGDA